MDPYDLNPTGHLAAQFPELEQMACRRCHGTGRVTMDVEGQRMQMPCAVCAEGWHKVGTQIPTNSIVHFKQRCHCGEPITLEVERDAGECLECLHRRYILAYNTRMENL